MVMRNYLQSIQIRKGGIEPSESVDKGKVEMLSKGSEKIVQSATKDTLVQMFVKKDL